MIEPDASERECVGWPDVSDASDAFRAGEEDAKRHAAAPQRGSRTPTKQGGSPIGRHTSAGGSKERAEGRAALLDSTSPSAASHPPGHDVHAGEDPPEPFECAIAREVHFAAWPIVEAMRGSGLSLVALSLTTPREESILADGARFAEEAGERRREGVLLARDVGPVHGRKHFYGPALTQDPAELLERWCALTGASRRRLRRTHVTGWPDEVHIAYGHFGVALGYTFKRWPDGFGWRSLTRDVFASGVFAAPWRAARIALEGRPMRGASRPGEAPATRRTCPLCGMPLDPRKRSHATWCSTACKRAAWERAHPHRKGPRAEPDERPNGAP